MCEVVGGATLAEVNVDGALFPSMLIGAAPTVGIDGFGDLFSDDIGDLSCP